MILVNLQAAWRGVQRAVILLIGWHWRQSGQWRYRLRRPQTRRGGDPQVQNPGGEDRKREVGEEAGSREGDGGGAGEDRPEVRRGGRRARRQEKVDKTREGGRARRGETTFLYDIPHIRVNDRKVLSMPSPSSRVVRPRPGLARDSVRRAPPRAPRERGRGLIRGERVPLPPEARAQPPLARA